MKKILVTSDSHGKIAIFEKIMNMHKDADMFIHLGDIVTDGMRMGKRYKVNMECVRGNCDMMDYAPFYKEFQVEGMKIIAVHGHMQRVKFSLTRLGLLAMEKHANIVLFGHTHVPHCEFNNAYYINPGAVMDGKYAVITIDEGKVNCDLCKV